MKKVLVLSCLIATIMICCAFINRFGIGDDPVPIPKSHQRTGNAQKGFTYLTEGDYIRSGIPYSVFLFGAGKATNDYLHRGGLNKDLPYSYTAIKASNGEVVVAPNCLQCHAQVFDGKLIIGLGNTLIDFTPNQKLDVRKLEMLEKMLRFTAPKQYEAAASFLTVTKTVSPYLTTSVRGVNTADRLAAVLAAHRDPTTFKWLNDSQLSIPEDAIPTDTPPWWLLKKKNAMFYNGFGRGDFGRFLMASNLLTVHDTSESGMVDRHMPDVLSYLYSIQPPKYPGKIDQALAKKGSMLFEDYCSSCHGSYGDKGSYPNLLIPESVIKTDSFLYKSNYSSTQIIHWINNSWFTKGDHPARLEPFEGYIAPPLDGIWITAPYLHNGSVPTLEALLNSKIRPRYWSRDFGHPEYDYEHIGWKFKTEAQPNGTKVYNTDLKGYGNYGHYFGDVLTEEERKAVLEYLKTL